MTFLTILQSNSTTYLVLIGLLGLLIGSFLNVVIYRLPILLNQRWQEEQGEQESKTSQPLSLSIPRSFCPHCRHSISMLDNIPIFSYLWLRGRCRACQKRIPYRYPLIEFFTCLLSIIIANHFGISLATITALLLTWALIALSIIDFDHSVLPDDITLPFLWLGLFFSLFPVFQNSEDCILGAIAGYLTLWTIYWLFKGLTGKEGMGYGDFKLLAMLGAWLGWQALPSVILIASILGALIGIYLMIFQGRDKNQPIPFGPFLAIGGWMTLLWQNDFLLFYFKLFNL